jgi:hypothetical protein
MHDLLEKPNLAANLRSVLWSDILHLSAEVFSKIAIYLYAKSIKKATEASRERDKWWAAGYSYRDGKLVAP